MEGGVMLVKSQEKQTLQNGYRRMAEDTVQEQEALEWCEALCGDALGAEEEAPGHAEERISPGK